MRKLIVAIAFLLSGLIYQAQRVVALHGTAGVTIYSSVNPFVDAYNASVAGDTLYLPGGAFAAPALIDKQLYIYGAGYHPDSTVATNPTLITGNFNLGDNADNLMVEGVQFANTIITANNISVNNVSFKRCRINGGINFPGSGTTPSLSNAFAECVIIGDLTMNNLTNSAFLNCFITNRLLASNSNVYKNCIFFYNSGNYDGVMHAPHYNEFSNNIFLIQNGSYLIYNTNNGNLYNNNLFVATTPHYGNNPIVTNSYLGIPQVDIFVNQTSYTYSYVHDYHLQDPSTYVGNDALQIGVYGGSFPFKAGAVPVNPHVSSKTIAPATTPNGELQITIKVGAQQN
jgi:hypothetical protein